MDEKTPNFSQEPEPIRLEFKVKVGDKDELYVYDPEEMTLEHMLAAESDWKLYMKQIETEPVNQDERRARLQKRFEIDAYASLIMKKTADGYEYKDDNSIGKELLQHLKGPTELNRLGEASANFCFLRGISRIDLIRRYEASINALRGNEDLRGMMLDVLGEVWPAASQTSEKPRGSGKNSTPGTPEQKS